MWARRLQLFLLELLRLFHVLLQQLLLKAPISNYLCPLANTQWQQQWWRLGGGLAAAAWRWRLGGGLAAAWRRLGGGSLAAVAAGAVAAAWRRLGGGSSGLAAVAAAAGAAWRRRRLGSGSGGGGVAWPRSAVFDG